MGWRRELREEHCETCGRSLDQSYEREKRPILGGEDVGGESLWAVGVCICGEPWEVEMFRDPPSACLRRQAIRALHAGGDWEGPEDVHEGPVDG